MNAECQRIADAAARRLLAEGDRDALESTPGVNLHPCDDGGDELAALRKRERVPALAGVEGQGEAA